jgi:MFS family permease
VCCACLRNRVKARRVSTFVFLTVFLDLIGFGIIIPLLPLYVHTMGGSAQTVGFILSSFAFTQLIATPFLGRLSDKLGRRPVILVSLAGNALSMVLFALATQTRALPLLFISRIIAGATAGNISACQAAIADVTDGEERAKGMGRVGAAISLGMVLGPASGSALATLGAWGPPLGAALLALLDLGFAFFLMPETRAPDAPVTSQRERPRGALREAFGDRKILTVLGLYFLLFLALTNLQVALALLAKERFGWGETETGASFAAFGGISLIVQGLLIGRLVRLFRPIPMAMVGGIAMAFGLAMIAESRSSIVLGAGVCLMALGMGINGPILSTLASDYAGARHRGAILGFAQSSGGLARTVGPVLSGFLFTLGGSTTPFLSGAAASVLFAIVAFSLRRD